MGWKKRDCECLKDPRRRSTKKLAQLCPVCEEKQVCSVCNEKKTVDSIPKFGAGLPDGLFSKPKIQIWVIYEVPFIGKCWYILWPTGKFYGHSG
jgi:hypothetical protein